MKIRLFLGVLLLIFLFALKTNAQGSNDTVTVTPQKPTLLDSLHFDLYNASHCCCTQYYYKNVSVTDTLIMLSFEYDDSMCILCDCFAAGSHAVFSCGPQRAGKYGIYKSESIYCRGLICPLIPGPIMIKRVGEVTVFATTSVIPEKGSATIDVISSAKITQSSSGAILRLNLDRAQTISVSAYSINGVIVKTVLPNQHFSPGAHSIALGTFLKTCGVTILDVRGETFSHTQLLKNIR